MAKQLYINGVGSATYKIFITSDTYLDSPSLDYTEYKIPAVDGNQIIYNKRLNNVVRKFECFVKVNPVSNLTAFKKLIYNNTGYMKIESDYDTDTYQYGYLAQEIQVDPFRSGSPLQLQFTLYFSCKPQKWFNTNSSSNRFSIPAMGGTGGLVKSTNYQLKKELSVIPIDSQPNEPYYLQFTIKTSLSQQTITDISATNSEGGFVGVTVDTFQSLTTVEQTTICYGEGSASLASYTLKNGTSQVRVVSEITPGATITGTITLADSTVESFTANLANNEVTITNTNAFGVALTNELEYNIYSSDTIVENGFVLTGYLDNVKISSSMIVIHFTEMTNDLRTILLNDFATNNMITVTIDSDFNVYATKGTNRIELTSLSEIIGNVDGRCDKITATYLGGYANTGGLKYATMQPEWWKL